ncbi:unnamed protein product, partial [Staurois parvus]
MWAVCALHCKHTAFLCRAIQSSVQELTGRELHCLHTDLSPFGNTKRSPGAS